MSFLKRGWEPASEQDEQMFRDLIMETLDLDPEGGSTSSPKVALGAGVLRRNPPCQTVYQLQTDVLAAATGVEHSSAPLRAWKQRHQSTEEERYLHRRARHESDPEVRQNLPSTNQHRRVTAAL